jgi:hypothetical protein
MPLGGSMVSGPTDVLQRIEKNTEDTARWLKILSVLTVVLIAVVVLLV